jgi:hypothetical protein
MGLLILHEPRYVLVGDATNEGLCSYCIPLEFMWRLHLTDMVACAFRLADEATPPIRMLPTSPPVVHGDCHKRVLPHQFTKHSLTHFIASRMRLAGRTRCPGVRHFARALAGRLTHRPYLQSFHKHHIRHIKE